MEFAYQLTSWTKDINSIKFAELQLNKYGGRPYIYKQDKKGRHAIFVENKFSPLPEYSSQSISGSCTSGIVLDSRF